MSTDLIGFSGRHGLRAAGRIAVFCSASAGLAYAAGPLVNDLPHWFALGASLYVAVLLVRMLLFWRWGVWLTPPLAGYVKEANLPVARPRPVVRDELAVLVVYSVLLWAATAWRHPHQWGEVAAAACSAFLMHGLVLKLGAPRQTDWPVEWQRYRPVEPLNPEAQSNRLVRRERRQSRKGCGCGK